MPSKAAKDQRDLSDESSKPKTLTITKELAAEESTASTPRTAKANPPLPLPATPATATANTPLPSPATSATPAPNPPVTYHTLSGQFGTNPAKPIKFVIKGPADQLAEHDDILGLWVKGKGADGKHKFFPTYRSAVTQRTNNKNSYAIFQYREGTNVIEVPAAFKSLIEFVTRVNLYADHQIPRQPQEHRHINQGFFHCNHHPTAYIDNDLDFYLDPFYSQISEPLVGGAPAAQNVSQILGAGDKPAFHKAIQSIRRLPIHQRPTPWLRERIYGRSLQRNLCFLGANDGYLNSGQGRIQEILRECNIPSLTWNRLTQPNPPFFSTSSAEYSRVFHINSQIEYIRAPLIETPKVGIPPKIKLHVVAGAKPKTPTQPQVITIKPPSPKECVHKASASRRTSRRSLSFKFRECKFCSDCQEVEEKRKEGRLRKPSPSNPSPLDRVQYGKTFNRIQLNLKGILGTIGDLAPTKSSESFLRLILDQTTVRLLKGQLELIVSEVAYNRISELSSGIAQLAAIKVTGKQAIVLTTLTRNEPCEEEEAQPLEVTLPENYQGPLNNGQNLNSTNPSVEHIRIPLEFEQHKTALWTEKWELAYPTLNLWRGGIQKVEVEQIRADATSARPLTRSQSSSSDQSVDQDTPKDTVEGKSIPKESKWLVTEGMFLAMISKPI